MLIQKKPVAFFTNPDDLSTKYSIALIKLINTNPRVGWVRADQIPSNSTLEEFAKIVQERDELKSKLHSVSSDDKVKIIEDFITKHDDIELKYLQKVELFSFKRIILDNYNLLLTGSESNEVIRNSFKSSGIEERIPAGDNGEIYKSVRELFKRKIEVLFNALVIKGFLDVYEVVREKAERPSAFMLRLDKTYEVKKYKLTELGKKYISENL